MAQKDKSERYKSFDVMLPQGARSRHLKAVQAMESADELVPIDALEGTSAELRQAIKHLQSATENLSELMAYRKMIGID
ncbi:hypothetical protein CEW89_08570 [Celeribacter ethanolicus]|uniref:Uncharacterized protein n=1 Tax=Celeribacter ethanolicus TaxID=1758178 RepID=A0A291GC59_9RHOB|nr:hypothetical protein [Celeribacter ethanolicus]ATG47622.1 hypothetical protein CEW89_08570 [Celeribacter ethanolicus]